MTPTAYIQALAEVSLATRGSLGGAGGKPSRPLSLDEAAEQAFDLLQEAKRTGGTVLAIGNGGSQVVAQHVEMDLCNRAGMRARSFSSTPVMTALCNDHGHEKAYAMLLGSQSRSGDVLIAVSSSGASPNIVAAAKVARAMDIPVITFSGFEADNNLRAAGDLNFWVDSDSYGFVELAHETLVHYLSDRCVEAEQKSRKPRPPSVAAAPRPLVQVPARRRWCRCGATAPFQNDGRPCRAGQKGEGACV